MAASVTDIDWVVISLKRTPERLAEFFAINAHMGLQIEAIEAVDGTQLDRHELVRTGLIPPDLPWGPGTIGAALSHRLCWLRAAESGRPVCIFEDDAYLRHDFTAKAIGVLDALPADWDLIHFGFNTDSVLSMEILPGWRASGRFNVDYLSATDFKRFVRMDGSVVPIKLDSVFGTSAYAVTPQGARKLIEGCFPLNTHAVFVPGLEAYLMPHSGDGVMNGLYRSMAAYVCMPPIAMPINDKRVSTVNSP